MSKIDQMFEEAKDSQKATQILLDDYKNREATGRGTALSVRDTCVLTVATAHLAQSAEIARLTAERNRAALGSIAATKRAESAESALAALVEAARDLVNNDGAGNDYNASQAYQARVRLRTALAKLAGART